MNDKVASAPRSAVHVVRCSVEIDRAPDTVWATIGAFGDAGRFLNVPCHLEAGTGEIGSARRVGEAIVEVMVGSGLHSYTYVQTEGPMAVHGYHGCVALGPAGDARTRLVYTLLFQAGDMTSDQIEAERVRLGNRFQGAIEEMRRVVEAMAGIAS